MAIYFIKSNLAASYFLRCKFIETTFKNSNLDPIVAREIKCWKLNQCTEIETSSNCGNILKDIDLASWDEE